MAVSLAKCWCALMRINRFSSLILFFLFAVPAGAAVDLKTVKSLLAEKKSNEAIQLLKDHHKALLRSPQDRQELGRWLSLFIFEDSMAAFERAVGFSDLKPQEAESEFKKALSIEPYNKTLIQNYASFLLTQQRWKEAVGFIDEKRAEQPYMDVYNLYGIHARSQIGDKPAPPICESKDYDEVELKYCYLVQLIVKVSSAGSKEQLDIKDLRAQARKIKIPEAYYWVWKGREETEDLQSYVTLCKNLSDKDKKIYKVIPGVCLKSEEAAQKLKTVAFIYEINNLGSLEERTTSLIVDDYNL